MTSDDQRLVVEAQVGDQRAFQELVQRYQRRVYGVALGIVRNPDDAMDIAQEAFVKVHRNLDRFKGSSSFYTWLYRIVVNLCIDHVRKSRRVEHSEFDDSRVHEGPASLVPTVFHGDPARSLDRREIREHVERALDGLSANHRAVIVMREVEGLSYTEMAHAMRCSKGTIMSRLFHARRKLQSALLEQMDGDDAAAIAERLALADDQRKTGSDRG